MPGYFDLNKRVALVTGASLRHGRGAARSWRDRHTQWPRRKHAKDRR